ncbi:TPA: YchE family NAAT transporter [Klebsiella pneumoniae]|uniref:YchE family NAAT transporter n=1 Tax=Klebsiella pneumoniae TaxID=573 RepID=UPI0007CC085F|nr:YchE family NAAT transporter [Klebsiella pneumoniae]EKV8920135.1 YchE family NAAT transporter [Klebsiella pneumoniae]SAU55939.1 membrane protein [Klebsiella pneumoniae]HBS6485169.1 YchE family NAAT transporter [Klebsiella pneumoniae]HBZ1454062.1 YchE family NAAT transporter [Klebsiella pneumoniae]HEE0470368.1 YchE family NAAT transporter [Klebsiella pneumoniae]
MTQSLFDFSAYFKFFIGLFALVNPVGIIPVFISMTSYQPAAVRNKTNLTANLSVAIILLTSLFLGDGILQIFGISIDSFRIAGGILVVTIAMSMISGKLGEDKQNKQEKSETAVRESIGVVPLALPLMAGPGAISSTIVWGTRYHSWVHLVGFSLAIAVFALCCWGIFRMAPWLVRWLGQTGINVITRIMGLLLMALGIEFIVTGIKALFPGLLS